MTAADGYPHTLTEQGFGYAVPDPFAGSCDVCYFIIERCHEFDCLLMAE
jgi:hypothetical protein